MSSSLLAFSEPPIGSLDLDPTTAMILAFFFVFLNGFFVAGEFALVKVRPTQIEPHVKEGKRGKVAYHMLDHLDAYLSATQLGITLASLALGWIGEPAFAHLMGPLLQRFGAPPEVVHSVSLLVAFLVITVLHIVLGELAPKSLAIRKPEPTSLWVAVPLWAFYKVTYPAIWILNACSNAFLRLLGIAPVSGSEIAHSEEEIRRLLASTERTELSSHKRELLDNIFELSERIARQIMVPRADVVFLSTTLSLEENLERARQSGHTRFPLCEGDLDHVLGLVHIKDLFRAGEVPSTLMEVRRDMPLVPETLPLDRLMRRMRAGHVHMAGVLDEYGSVSGIVALENVIEEIVGEIQDEFDQERPEVVKLGENSYQIDGSMLLQDLEDELGIELAAESRDEDTIAGVVLSAVGRRPRVGDDADVGPLHLEVLEVGHNRIRTLKVTIEPEFLEEARGAAGQSS